MQVPAQFAAEQAILRQNVALSVIKQSADQEKQLVKILEQSLTTVQNINSSRGSDSTTRRFAPLESLRTLVTPGSFSNAATTLSDAD